VFLFFSFNYTTKEVERTRIIVQEKKIIQYIINTTYSNTTKDPVTNVTTTVIVEREIVIPEYTATFSKLSYIFYKVFEPEFKCKTIKSLPNDNRDSDGTWSFCDDFKPTPPCVEYSFGIAGDFRFEDAYHSYTGCDVHAYDPSMKTNDYVRNTGVWFWNAGISAVKNDNFGGKEYGGRGSQVWKVDTIQGYMDRFGHAKGALLKIDVEGNEWDALLKSIEEGTLQKWDQLLFEIHLWGYEQNVDTTIDKWFRLFKGLENQSYQLFYSHVNPASTRTNFNNHFYVPCCYELSFMRTNAIKNYQ